METRNSTKRRRNASLQTGSVSIENVTNQNEPMSKALQNPLILHKICNHLDFPELKICRRVNSIFLTISSEVITKRDCSIVQIYYCKSGSAFCQMRSESTRRIYFKAHKLMELVKILENNNNKIDVSFPCSNFTFLDSNLEALEVQTLFHLFGHSIKTLKLLRLNNNGDTTTKQIFCRILLDLVPNLENLFLSRFDYDWSPVGVAEKEEKLFLPSLKSFSWFGCPDTALKILEGASNLKMIPSMDPFEDDFNILEKSGKVSLLKDISLYHFSKSKAVSKLATMGPQLEIFRLYFPTVIEEEEEICQKILESSSKSLKFLGFRAGVLSKMISVPKLDNLSQLALYKSGRSSVFPRGMNLTETFPHIRVLDVSYLTTICRDENWDKLFPLGDDKDRYREKLPSVKKLKISSSTTELWMSELLSLCPSFNELVITNSCLDYFEPPVLSKVFKLWGHLVVLKIEMNECTGHNNFFMDTLITGIPPDDCTRLVQKYSTKFEEKREIMDFWKLRKELSSSSSSILDLKALNMFHVELPVGFVLPFSRVSGLFAFKLMPDLKVVVQLDHQKWDTKSINSFYNEVGPYVNIRHFKESV